MTQQDRRPIRRALISVYDKTRLKELGEKLHSAKITIISTGSTASFLREAGIPVTPVENYTGFPEILGGRVKTLHPRIHAGLLADQNNPAHVEELKKHDIETFDLVIINLYPFEKTIASGATIDDCIEQIDIGGPAMLRGSAKNHGSVAVISDPTQYDLIYRAIENGGFSLQERRELALATFQKTARYDSAIEVWLSRVSGKSPEPNKREFMTQSWEKVADLRYGENPHQSAALYRDHGPSIDSYNSSVTSGGLAGAELLHGKAMSFNNYIDADAAWRAVWEHHQPAVAIIKHTNPCGIAIGSTIAEAYRKAHACDSLSAFGGVIAANREVTEEMALNVSEVFTEVIIAPAFERKAFDILAKKSSLRIVQLAQSQRPSHEIRPILGGVLIQSVDALDAEGDSVAHWQQVSGEVVSDEILADLQFAWRSVRSVKSNAIVCARYGATVGIGMGQVNRVDSARLAVSRGGNRISGSVAASDAFFPFADGLTILTDAGVCAVVQPGGSVRDEEVIAAAQAAGIAMFFTGVRHFSHT